MYIWIGTGLEFYDTILSMNKHDASSTRLSSV